MSQEKVNQSLSNLGRAIVRLEEALDVEPNPLIIDGTIQRFEFVIELFWKTFKRCLEFDGIHTKTPKEALRKAFASELIDNEDRWLEMLTDRNNTAHVYDESMANKIYEHIKHNFPEMKAVYEKLTGKYLKES